MYNVYTYTVSILVSVTYLNETSFPCFKKFLTGEKKIKQKNFTKPKYLKRRKEIQACDSKVDVSFVLNVLRHILSHQCETHFILKIINVFFHTPKLNILCTGKARQDKEKKLK